MVAMLIGCGLRRAELLALTLESVQQREEHWVIAGLERIPWQMLPHELGCGSGMTCWRRLRDWHLAGVWDLIHFAMLDWLARHDQVDWSRAVVDSCSVRAVCGGNETGPNPTDRQSEGANAT